MPPAQIERLNRCFDCRIVGQQTQKPARLEILRNTQQRQQANALALKGCCPDGLDAVAAQISSDLDLVFARSTGRRMPKDMEEWVASGLIPIALELRGSWHPACFKSVQRDVIMATRTWVKGSIFAVQPHMKKIF